MNRLSDNQRYACNIAGLYLSLHDEKAYERLSPGISNKKNVHEFLGFKFKVSPAFIKINRDEFDYHVDNARAGFRRELTQEKSSLLEKYKNLTEEDLYKELTRVLSLVYVSHITKSSDETSIPTSGKIKIQQFTELGNTTFKDYFAIAENSFKTNGSFEKVPFSLLSSKDNVVEFEEAEEITINKLFKNRYELGKYLYQLLKNCDEKKIYNNELLWNWVSAALFSSLYPSPRKGGQEMWYILHETSIYKHRHLCYYSWLLYRQFRDLSKILLTSQANSISDDFEQIASNRQLLNENFIKLITEMYLIEDQMTETIKFKKGVNANKRGVPGTVRRLKTIYKRLSSNYFIEKMKYNDFKNSVIEFSDEFNRHFG